MSFEEGLRKKVCLSLSDVDITSYEFAAALENNDKLKSLRKDFYYPKMKDLPNVDKSLVNLEADSIYLCGNSLGLLAKGTENYVKEQLDKWAKLGVLGHTTDPLPWAHCDESALELIAKLVGAEPVEIALMNSLTVNLHCFLTAFCKLTPKRHKILLEYRAFPSDHYALESHIRLQGYSVEDSLICLRPREGEECLKNEDILNLIEKEGSSIAIVFFSGVQYYTGQYFDIKAITEAGHAQGCIVGWDLAHAFCNVPLFLHDWNVDFAVWCTYKYASSGAGGIGGAFLHKKYKDDKRDRLLGWWGHKMSTRFQMDNKLDLAEGAAGYRISTPPVMLMLPLLGTLDIFAKTTMTDLREKSVWLTGYLEYLINHYLSATSKHKTFKKISCSVITPSNPKERGCQLSLKFNIDIEIVFVELSKRGVVVDKRYPNVIRVTPVHLYNSFTDVHRFVTALLDSLRVIEV